MYKESSLQRKYQKSIFIFRRDLRLKDNTALINALYSSNSVYCFFILDSNILLSNSLYSSFSLPIDPILLLKRKQRRIHLLRFLKESLLDLQKQFDKLDIEKEKEVGENNLNISSNLTFLLGDPVSTIKKIIQTDKKIEAVFVNRDYTPYSIERDQSIEEICRSFNIDFIECSDILINEPEEILNSTNEPFKVFSHYYNKAIEKPLRKESSFDIKKYKKKIINFDNNNSRILKNFDSIERIINIEEFFSQIINEQFPVINNTNSLSSPTQLLLIGTRKKYRELISALKYKFNKDNKQKEYINLLDNTASHLSPYLKFGICSIREVYSTIQKELGFNHRLLRQLYWRDFYVYIGYHFPFVFTRPFKGRYKGKSKTNVIRWKNDPHEFEIWCNGKTGFPIVDAGMRELNETGYMHNRVRLITASFLVKDLHIDWRYGERYFALKLVDYDPSINNGNWQWVASTGCDAQPFFRIFNPWLQQKKFDPNCNYIKKWIPELKGAPVNLIHEWYNTVNATIDKSTKLSQIENYPRPIVEHQKEIIVTRDLYNI
ncbi:MAG: deoxyribodipyrimidine photolyase [Nitrososphaeraceae archaeon]|jgi:deoxyribodipyrimidine photo-lyase|nr:deoxyribodipyrimidine photolyase [Nitrososphaeraceae archaeon]